MRILVACDASDGGTAALQAAAKLASKVTDSKLLLLHVLNPQADAVDVFAQTLREAVDIKIHDERVRLVRQILALEITGSAEARVEELDRGEDVSDAIIRVAKEWKADAIAIASRRAASLRGAILGSVAGAVVQDGGLPVLIVRP